MSDLLLRMQRAVLEGNEAESRKLAEEAVTLNMDMVQVLDEGFLLGVQEAGRLYQDGEYFLPNLVMASDAMKAAMEVVQPELDKIAGEVKYLGTVVMATVKGDIHDIGKTIVSSMLTASGFKVIDLGNDVPFKKIIDTVAEYRADIVGLSSLLTFTMEQQQAVISQLDKKGLRKQVRVMVGGAPVSLQWAQEIGADGYGENAVYAVEEAKRLMQ